MSTAFLPKDFPRTKLSSGRVLSDSQQYQYDVLRSVGGKILKRPSSWHRADTGEKIYGLNAVAMWKLVELGLAESIGTRDDTSLLFVERKLAKDISGPRYERTNHLIRIVKDSAP